jgi:membrane-associated PAP2 superfamily phosphatase
LKNRLIWFHALGVPVILIAIATWLRLSGLDTRISDAYFDGVAHVFPGRSNALLELLGHGLARNFATLIWFCLAGGAIASRYIDDVRPYGSVLWLTAAAMALGPILVVILKDFTAFPCPWSLKRYGGFAAEPTRWFVMPSHAGKCFPAGHSAGGFSFLAFYFAALAMRCKRLASAALVLAVLAGCAFSFVRVVQGAHFVSHALWSAAIDWLMAALVFFAVMSGKWPLWPSEARWALCRSIERQ